MNPRVFTNVVEWYHLEWLQNILKLNRPDQLSIDCGIDLLDQGTAVELKSRLKKYSHNFAVHAYQIDEYESQLPDHTLFWAFLFYDLTKPVKKIEAEEVGSCIKGREAWFMDWKWIKQFPQSNVKTGPYVYVHKNNFPAENNFVKMKEKGGTLYVPKNSILEERLYLPF